MNEQQMGQGDERMDEFEQSLTRALKRVEAPAVLSAKLLGIAGSAEQQQRRVGGKLLFMPRPAVRAWVGGAIAAALAAGVFAGEQMREREQQRKQAVAEQQFETAMRVTDHALDQTRARLERAGLKLGD